MTAPEGALDAELTDLAEQALLGSLLWEPRRLPEVNWLQPSDFHRPIHRAIYESWSFLAGRGQPQLSQLLDEVNHRDVHTGTSINVGVVVTDLLAITRAAPAHDHLPEGTVGDHSGHVQYALLVLESSVRREVLAMGSRIEQAAEISSDQHTYSPVVATESMAQAVLRQIDRSAKRLNELTDQLTAAPVRELANGTPPAGLMPAAGPRGNIRYRDYDRAEHALIGASMRYRDVLDLAVGRLVPDDFSNPHAAAAWTSITALHTTGANVDFVLVAARQRRDSAQMATPALRPTELVRLAQRADIASGYHALASVTHGALARAVDRTHRLLDMMAADPSLSTGSLLPTARGALAQLTGDIHRLTDEVGPFRTLAPSPRPPLSQPRPPARSGVVAAPNPAALNHGRARGR